MAFFEEKNKYTSSWHRFCVVTPQSNKQREEEKTKHSSISESLVVETTEMENHSRDAVPIMFLPMKYVIFCCNYFIGSTKLATKPKFLINIYETLPNGELIDNIRVIQITRIESVCVFCSMDRYIGFCSIWKWLSNFLNAI